jgi:hypothetical protein
MKRTRQDSDWTRFERAAVLILPVCDALDDVQDDSFHGADCDGFVSVTNHSVS